MARNVLFFGDSNTHGYGVGPAKRWATLVENQLKADASGSWTYSVSGTRSDFRLIRDRLPLAVEKYAPDVLVWQLPTGPMSYYVRYPKWVRPARRIPKRFFRYHYERHVDAQLAAEGGARTRSEVISEGLFLDQVQVWKPSRWFGFRAIRRWMAHRYGVEPKVTKARYLDLVESMRAAIRERSRATLVLVAFVPHSDVNFPGFSARAREWLDAVRETFHRPQHGQHVIDVFRPVTAEGTREVLLRDGFHMSPHGHEKLAKALAPELRSILAAGE